MDNIPASQQASPESRRELAEILAAEMLNPLYCVDTRRSQSVVRDEYVAVLDGWFDASYSRATYPRNSRGSLARIPSHAVEFFVDILHLNETVREESRSGGLAAAVPRSPCRGREPLSLSAHRGRRRYGVLCHLSA
ncbi:MAG: hypothetical protein AB2L14_10100 [Candidatus Xenobiia bacterium LiM19]